MARFLNTGYQLDDDIPIPEIPQGKVEFRRPTVKLNLPFQDLRVGESFLTTADPVKVLGQKGAHNCKKGKYFVHRHVQEEGVAGIRIWRTA